MNTRYTNLGNLTESVYFILDIALKMTKLQER